MSKQQTRRGTMIERIKLPKNLLEKIDNFYTKQDEDDFMLIAQQQFAIARVKQIDKFIIKKLFEIYKEKADELIIIDETEFEEFIRKYFPIYIKEKNNA